MLSSTQLSATQLNSTMNFTLSFPSSTRPYELHPHNAQLSSSKNFSFYMLNSAQPSTFSSQLDHERHLQHTRLSSSRSSSFCMIS
ncbi:hypothetical protein L195_g057593 [Trifolium pratense]|uniref:Uncharacterized protein n=1 Tax=Trifolium pratense TaxID=57577 RepID=A0A2K3KWH5_TRIPR|nr:hypothetical protein L195_g057593 [Trifolium pratense]